MFDFDELGKNDYKPKHKKGKWKEKRGKGKKGRKKEKKGKEKKEKGKKGKKKGEKEGNRILAGKRWFLADIGHTNSEKLRKPNPTFLSAYLTFDFYFHF